MVIFSDQWKDLILDALLCLFLVCAFYTVIISPLLYRYWIIPKIEKRYQEKVVYSPPILFASDPLQRIGVRSSMVSITIVLAYFGWCFGIKRVRQNNGLYKINYDIKTASKAELIMSFVDVISFFLVFALGGCLYFIY